MPTPTEVSMELGEQLNRQRVKHIVSSYQLDSEDAEAFNGYLEELLNAYSFPLIELAIVETLVDNWITIPMPKGHRFLVQVHDLMKSWESRMIEPNGFSERGMVSTIAPEQFRQITGLDPTPIFGPLTSSQPPTYPLSSGF
ncbi:hypothetical protein K9N68_16980 [Kovacikia minuta CCNUW1]|uniref:hypothetical protein n=1 Tax=Kovacikia minuta TaxID=2931930 RepID=UPI001CCE7371|nr:hypothetical protein [Kovacikia minuta]UBF29375.1 hypothetical protein K9N68_16980 [Kovacikia minuta CCNUW1]